MLFCQIFYVFQIQQWKQTSQAIKRVKSRIFYIGTVINKLDFNWTSLVAQLIICLQCMRPWLDSWVRKIPWRRDRLPIPVSLEMKLICTQKPIYKCCESCSVVSDSMTPWNSPGQNIGVGSLSLLQRIFPMQGLNPGILHCRWILYCLSHQGSPKILEWVAYPFSSRSS